MKTIKFILKGILFYSTTIITMLWICGIDSITEKGYLIEWTFTIIIMICICCKIISEEEFNKFTFNK